jgi:hypothetical protein
MKLVPRLASPVGFLLALLFFFLPFVAVSCDVPGVGSAGASYTGLDLVTNGRASVELSGAFEDLKNADPRNDTKVQVPKEADSADTGVQALAIITVALLAIGLGVSLVPVLRTRMVGAMAAAVAGGALLITTEAVAQSNLESTLIDSTRQSIATNPGDSPINFNGLTDSLFADMVHSRYGFWFSLVAVILVLLYNGGTLLWPRIRAVTQTAGQAPPAAPPPPPPADEPAEPPPVVVAELPVEPAPKAEGEPPPPQ